MIVCSGDGDSYAIGIGHAVHAMKRNMNMTYLVFDNQVYGLTKGQTSPRSSKGFVTKTTPQGNAETPLAVLPMAIACGCTSWRRPSHWTAEDCLPLSHGLWITRDFHTSIFLRPALHSIMSIHLSGTVKTAGCGISKAWI